MSNFIDDDIQRTKITKAIMLAIGNRPVTLPDERGLAAGRVYGQVITPLMRKAWDEGYGAGRDDEAVSLGFYDPTLPHSTGAPNPYAGGSL